MTRVFPTLKPKLSANFRSSYATRTHATKTILSLCTGRYSRYRPGNPSQYLQVWLDSNWCLLSHKVADALLVVMFANGWVAVARRDTDVLCPRFGLAKLFPPINLSGFNPSTGITKEKIVTRRSVFSASSVASLREKYAASYTYWGHIGCHMEPLCGCHSWDGRPKKSLHDPAGDEPKYKDGPSIDGELLWEYCPVCDNNTKHGRYERRAVPCPCEPTEKQ